MADVTISTFDQFKDAIGNSDTVDVNYVLTQDIDLNNDKYNWWTNDFITDSGSGKGTIDGGYTDSQGNLKRHIIANAYVYPTKHFFLDCFNCADNTMDTARVAMKNLEFEIILNNASFLWNSPKFGFKVSTNIMFENCIFNIRAYNITNSYPIFYLAAARSYQRFIFKNCVFNLYLQTSAENIINIFRNNSSDADKLYFEACIFKIRNATKKFISMSNSGQDCEITYDNCAVFYNDIGQGPAYSSMLCNSMGAILYDGHSRLRIINCYFSSFGPAPTARPRFSVAYGTDTTDSAIQNISNSFFDVNKLDCCIFRNSGNDVISITNPESIKCAALTTAQCKDPNKLNEIGYIFSSEV